MKSNYIICKDVLTEDVVDICRFLSYLFRMNLLGYAIVSLDYAGVSYSVIKKANKDIFVVHRSKMNTAILLILCFFGGGIGILACFRTFYNKNTLDYLEFIIPAIGIGQFLTCVIVYLLNLYMSL